MSKQLLVFGNHGWLRVVEACLAIIILIGFVMVINNKLTVRETNMQEKANEFVLKIEKEGELRQKIFDNTFKIDDLESWMPYGLALDINEKLYGSKPTNKEIFSSSVNLVRIIDGNPTYKKITLYIWK